MRMKDKLLKIKQKLKRWIMPEYLQQMEELSKSEDPLSFGALNNAVDRLIESKQITEKENQNISERERYEKMSQEEKIKYWAENHKTFTEQDITPAAKILAEHFGGNRTVVLDDKVDEFIKWYTNTMVTGNHTDIGEYQFPTKMRNFIEKMAVWYELRYPDYEINRIMYCSGQEPTQVSDEMFNKNYYINEQLDSDSEVRILDWDKFYNAKSFIHSLPNNEYFYLMRPGYPNIVYWNYGVGSAHLHLSKNGIVESSEYMDAVIPGISNEDFEGKNIKEVVEMIKKMDIQIPEKNEFVKAIQDYDNCTYQKEEMLNCVMYRIIERGEKRIGPRRAFLFAKEFGRNIDIPMSYGVDYADPGLRLFMNEYMKAGGSKELVCYVNYFSRASKYEKLDTVTMGELIKTRWNNDATRYTSEEDALHQRLVNVLATIQVDQEVISKEEVKRLRLERKLEKANQIRK